MMPKKILVVDDEEAIRTLFVQILGKEGFSVVTADNGLEALAVLQVEKPDVVFLDLDMPKMGGIETIGHIRPENPVPIIVLTGHATQDNVIRALTAGAGDFLVKSEVTLGIIRGRIRRALSGPPRRLPPAAVAPAPAPKVEEPSAGLREKIEAKLKKVVDMKALPFIATEIIQLAASPGSDAAVLTETISRDPAIAARVLLLANSAFYAVHGRIQNLTQAVTRIGFRGIHHVALAAAVMEEYRGTGRATGLDRIEFWKHSLACAVLGREMAAGVIKDADLIETSFLAGLLHDIGKAVLDENFHETYAAVLGESGRKNAPLHEQELKELGIDHAEVGRRIIVKWNLPEELIAPIVGHHAPLEAASAEMDRRLSIWVRAANTLAKALGIGFGGDGTLEEISDPAAAAAGLTPELVAGAVEKAPSEVGELTQIMLLHGAAPAKRPAARKSPAQGGGVILLREGTPIVDPVGVLLNRLGVQTRPADAVADALQATDARAVIVRPSSEAHLTGLIEAAGRKRPSTPLILLADSPPGRELKDKLKPLSPVYIVRPYSIRAIEKALAD